MNTNKFYLLIIIIILIIIISLFIQCNKKVLKNLEEKATKDIIETYYHLGSTAPTEPGQKGYKISSISPGRYGGRSSQEVLNNIGSHTVGDYISIDEKDSYGSNLFNPNISGKEKKAIDCSINGIINTCEHLGSSIDSHSIIRKLGNVVDLTNGMYGGTPCPINFYQYNNGNTYEVLKEDSPIQCNPSDEHHNLLNINVNIDNTITIDEPNYHGFFYSEEVSNLLDITLINNNIINNEILFKLLHNHRRENEDNIKDKMKSKYGNYLKYSKNGKYYNISINEGYKFVFTNCGKTGRLGPSQQQCDATYGSGVVETVEGIQNFIVPFSGIYKITATGGGKSSKDIIINNYNLDNDDSIKMVIGQTHTEYTSCKGGNGGTFLWINNDIVVISAGSGGDATWSQGSGWSMVSAHVEGFPPCKLINEIDEDVQKKLLENVDNLKGELRVNPYNNFSDDYSLQNGNFGAGGKSENGRNKKGGTGGGILGINYNDINCNYETNELTELGGDGGISYVKQGLTYEISNRNDSKKNGHGKVIIEYLGES